MRARRRSRAALTIVVCIGDSITAGSPLWDPDRVTRDGIDAPEERSQWEWWAARRHPGFEFRNHGVCGERTDEIAARFDDAVRGAPSLVVQGGINDVVQGRPAEEAARNHPSVEGHRLLGESAFRQP